MFARQCYLTSWYDPVKRNSGQIGTSNILWATNFPAANSTWPDTQAFAKKCLAGLTADERAQITYGNAAALYKL
jgi:predicted TIM-barrel fold metal-dependent hydrolase